MAQRTGADGLIASRVKVASAGVILALVTAAVLVLTGCGGSSDAPAQSATTGSEASDARKGHGETLKEATEGEDLSADAKNGTTGQGAAEVKQGPHIAPPRGPREQEATPSQVANATVADIALESPALSAVEGSTILLPAEYTCDGKGSWPELRWQGVPPGSEELILFTLGLQPVGKALFFNWAVAGLDPSLEGLEADRLPKGAILGRNGFGHSDYEICPDQGKAETYVFALYALPKALSPKPGFDPGALREQVLDLSGNAGLMAVSYGRE
jgi:phosphatidylethanolamine-binding protein (PEBP) family uncharacterized protein